MSKQLKRLISLAKKTGDRLIVFDNEVAEDSFVLLSLDQYEELLSERRKIDESEFLGKELDKVKKIGDTLGSEEEKKSNLIKIKEDENKEEGLGEKKSSFTEEFVKRDALIIAEQEKEESFVPSPKDDLGSGKISDGPLKETLRQLLTEKKIVDKIDDIEKNNANLKERKVNNWRISPDVMKDSE